MADDTYAKPTPVTDLQLAFPANLGELLPPYELIPGEFKRQTGEWVAFADRWFFEGFPENGVLRKEGIDAEVAYRHLATIMGSFEPKHEHKIAAVAWLSSRWFDGIA